MITATPIAYELYDESTELLAKINAFDDVCSNVEIVTVVDAGSWLELSAAIHKALLTMHPKKED